MDTITNYNLFWSSETSGSITSSLTMDSGASTLLSRDIVYDNVKPFSGGAALYAKLAGSGAGTVKVEYALYNGLGFMTTYHTALSSVADDGEVEVYLNVNDFADWKPHFGIRFKFTRLTGTGNIPFTEGRYVPETA